MGSIVYFPGAGGRASFWMPVADRLRDLGAPWLLGWSSASPWSVASGRNMANSERWTVSHGAMPPSLRLALGVKGIVDKLGG